MRNLIILLVHALSTLMRVVRPGGVRAVVAESVLAKHQLLILNRSRRRAPNLRILDRLILVSVRFGLNREGHVAIFIPCQLVFALVIIEGVLSVGFEGAWSFCTPYIKDRAMKIV